MPAAEFLLSNPDFWLSPEREALFASLRREQPVIWQDEPATEWSPGGRGYWAVIRHAEVREVTRRHEEFVSGLGTEIFELPPAVAETYSWLLNMDGERHTRIRAVAAAAFSPGGPLSSRRWFGGMRRTLSTRLASAAPVISQQRWPSRSRSMSFAT